MPCSTSCVCVCGTWVVHVDRLFTTTTKTVREENGADTYLRYVPRTCSYGGKSGERWGGGWTDRDDRSIDPDTLCTLQLNTPVPSTNHGRAVTIGRHLHMPITSVEIPAGYTVHETRRERRGRRGRSRWRGDGRVMASNSDGTADRAACELSAGHGEEFRDGRTGGPVRCGAARRAHACMHHSIQPLPPGDSASHPSTSAYLLDPPARLGVRYVRPVPPSLLRAQPERTG